MTDQAGVQVSGATGDLDDDEGGGLVGFNYSQFLFEFSFSFITVVWSMNHAYSKNYYFWQTNFILSIFFTFLFPKFKFCSIIVD